MVFVLVDDLQAIVVDILLIDEGDVFRRAVVAVQNLHIVLLDAPRLFNDAVVFPCNTTRKKLLPFAFRKGIIVEFFQLFTQIGDKLRLAVDGQIFVPQLAEQLDQFALQVGFALIPLRALPLRDILRQNGALFALRDHVVVGHTPSFTFKIAAAYPGSIRIAFVLLRSPLASLLKGRCRAHRSGLILQ